MSRRPGRVTAEKFCKRHGKTTYYLYARSYDGAPGWACRACAKEAQERYKARKALVSLTA